MPDRPTDRRFMERALLLARRAQGAVEPNPMVGCVLVRAGRIIGEGYHRRFGQRHAEVDALRNCAGSPRGATAYVTLEPCCFHGKTPPCSRALIDAGVARVFAATLDPNPRVAGGGIRQLRAAGIEVAIGLCRAQAEWLIAPYLKGQRSGRPWVILKWAQSLDGKIATRTGDSKWISDETARAHAHRVRGRVDGIMVGIGTALRDDPMLTARVGRARRTAARIVVDTHLRLRASSRLVRSANDAPVLLFCGRDASAVKATRLERAGCRVVRIAGARGGLSMRGLLGRLAREGMSNLLVEGGGRLLGAFADGRLGDELHVYIGPVLVGGDRAVPAVGGRGAATIRSAIELPRDARMRPLGSGWLIEARL